MTDRKFVELIFEPDPKSLAAYKLKQGYQSLTKNPQQLFALFIDVDLSTKFFSAFGVYGKTLALLLRDFPKYSTSKHSTPKSKPRLTIGKDDPSLRVPQENLGAFLFSLLANDFPDAASQQAVASIIMAVIHLSKPGGTLGLIGEKLGESPWILNRLIGRGNMAKLSLSQSTLFSSLTSNSTTLDSWARIVANNHTGHCPRHTKKSQGIQDWERMKQFLQSFPCETCPLIVDVDKLPAPRHTNDNLDGMNFGKMAFSSLLGHHLGPWKVVISERALRVLKEAAHSGNSDHIRESLLDLASGEWMKSSLRRPAGDDFQVPVYKVECEEYVILWQVDVAFDEREYHNTQVVKVWSICAPTQLDEMCRWVIRAHKTYTEARVTACQTVDLEAVGGAVYPMAVIPPGLPEDSCEEKLAAIFSANMETQLTAKDRAITKRSPILGKFYCLTSTVLGNIHPEASAAEFPVDPSGEEIHAINHFESPAFILGRGSSGKTTCLIYKLASRYLSNKKASEAPIRQLFLTRSKDLAQKLKLQTKRLINTSLGIIGKDQGSSSGNTSSGESEEDVTQDLLSLGEEDFPLFCTFEYFLMLLEDLIKVHNRRNARRAGVLEKVSRPVNLTTFKLEYWQRLPTALTRRIPMDLALIDIMGVIKGSASLASNFEPLSRDAYTARDWRLAPNFTIENDRKAVYTLYEHYEKIKASRGEADDTDRVIRVLEALNKDSELQQVVEKFLDEVYIDEVQCQRPLEIELLLSLIRDPRGIHFAGDTGQSVSKDSLFRFANSKALFNFNTRFNNLSSPIHKQSRMIPTLFPLSNNYRSHTGIQAIASIMMDLLYTAFPEQVDKLPFEIGDQPGPIPTLCVGSGMVSALHEAKISTKRDAKRTSKKNPANEDQGKLTSGKLRVILVRDEQTQSVLQMKVPTSTLVLTIHQSKGMEFDDVFLYNFFTTSPYSSDFNILGDLLYEHHSPKPGEHARYANWEMVDNTLCSELKHLYVGITRAQTRLWIVESEERAVLPAIDLFNKIVPALFPARYPNPLLKVVREYEFRNTSELRRLFHSAHQTTPTEWSELAYELIAKKAYIQAGLCFKNAQDQAGEALAKGYLAETKGMEHRARSSKKELTIAFGEACELFLKAGQISKAVECQEAIGNTEAAAELFSKNGRHQEAAWLFTKAGRHKEAAREYADLGKHEKILETYYHAGLYDDLASHLRDFAPEIDPKCRKQYSRLCYLVLIQEKCPPKLKTIITTSLGSSEEQESVFREFKMMNHVLDLHKTHRRFKDAYEVAINNGYPREAVRLAKTHGLSVSQPDLIKAFDYVQAEDLLSSIIHACNSQKSKPSRKRTRKSNNEVFLSLERKWKPLVAAFNDCGHGERPNRKDLQAGELGGFFDLLVTMRTLDMGNMTPDLISLPLDFIAGALNILYTIIFTKSIPFSTLLFLGAYEIPTRPGEYIILPWPTYICKTPERRFQTQNVGVKTICDVGGRLIRGLISTALDFVEAKSRNQLDIQTKNGHFQHKSDDGKLTSAQFSANVQGVLAINLLLSNFESVLYATQIQVEPVLAHRHFWQQALIRLITFTSCYEQDLFVLIKLKYDLTTTTSDFRRLYDQLGQYILSQLQSGIRPWPQKPFGLLSYLLQQVQTAAFLGVEVTAMKFILQAMPKQHELRSVAELLTLTKDVQTKTTTDDLPGYFCENVCSLLSRLRQVQNSRPQLLLYSPSIVSLYEELATLLIFLIRHIDFMTPQSWTAYYLPKFVEIPRCTSKREIFWYQRMLAKVVISFCELVGRTEDVAPKNQAKPDPLARRSLYLIVVCIINMGIMSPRPAGYDQMWKQAQKVFCHKGLNAEAFINLPPPRLFQNLAKAFGCYDGKDRLGVVVTNGRDLPSKFAGLSLGKLGIAPKYLGIPPPHKHRPRTPSAVASPNIQMMNSVYLITQLWETDGPKFVQRMKHRRERRERAAHLITTFWRANGPQFVRRMQCRRERTAYERPAQRQKPIACQNCCILAEMRYGKDYIY